METDREKIERFLENNDMLASEDNPTGIIVEYAGDHRIRIYDDWESVILVGSVKHLLDDLKSIPPNEIGEFFWQTVDKYI